MGSNIMETLWKSFEYSLVKICENPGLTFFFFLIHRMILWKKGERLLSVAWWCISEKRRMISSKSSLMVGILPMK
ncbi:hypothetical protein AAFF_G00039110 [Aldrovandia affinis]|uniref:Uncharacterized protein n=1 Tax=Aldrovandia affinis TaxID=143900 RepID=A0AAD7T5B7_9TELE|nr:hypothetical protein AAFF_G00039110 [Aldrovandia affinis]